MPLDSAPQLAPDLVTDLATSQRIARREFAKLLRSNQYTQALGPDGKIFDDGRIVACAIYAWAHNHYGYMIYPTDASPDAYNDFSNETGIPAWEIFPRNDQGMSFDDLASFVESYTPELLA